MGLEAPLTAVEAVTVSVVARFHAEETVVMGLGITVFILEDVDFAVLRQIGPAARSLCSIEWGNREWHGRAWVVRFGCWYVERWNGEDAVTDTGGSSGMCEAVAGLSVVSVSFTERGFDAVELVSLDGPCVSSISESLYLSCYILTQFDPQISPCTINSSCS
jgi:hypothetical protein